MKRILILLFLFSSFFASAQVRSLIGTDTANISKRINLIDVFATAGQSNAQGQGDSATSPDPDPNTVYQYYNGVISNGQDPVGNAATGSAWPAFGIKWNILTGRKVCFIPCAFPSTSIIPQSDLGNGNWSASGTLLDTAIARINACMAALRAAGYTPVFRGILWSQGETDAGAITATTITKAQYKTGLSNTIAEFRSTYGARMPFFIFRTGGANTAGRTAVMEAQYEIDTADRYTQIVYYNTADFPTRGLQNGAHYYQYGYDEMGAVGAVNTYTWSSDINPVTIQSDKVGIGTKIPAYNLDVNGTTNVTGAATFASTVNVTGTATYSNGIATDATTLTKDIGAAAAVWRIGYFGTVNSGTGNQLTLRTATASQPVAFQNGATEAARFAGTTGNLLLGTTTDVTKSILTLNSTTKVFLPPRMTATQASALSLTTTEEGGLIYVTNTNGTFTAKGIWMWDGAAWQKLNN